MALAGELEEERQSGLQYHHAAVQVRLQLAIMGGKTSVNGWPSIFSTLKVWRLLRAL